MNSIVAKILVWIMILFIAAIVTSGIFFAFVSFEEDISPSNLQQNFVQYVAGFLTCLFVILWYLLSRSRRSQSSVRKKKKGPLLQAREMRTKQRIEEKK